MMPAPIELAPDVARVGQRRVADFVELTKPRLVMMIGLTTLLGYYLGAPGRIDWLRLVVTLVGTGLAAGGTMALNQYYERDLDARMYRTRGRPLPDGRIEARDALAFGSAITVGGLVLLFLAVGPLPAAVTALTSVSYLFAYTPLKVRTSLCTLVGAVPGALPPLTGWAAASGTLDVGAWSVFAIMFLWQIPHSLAIAEMYRDDYARAGFRLLPVVDRDGGGTIRQILTYSFALLAAGTLPTAIGLAGPVYFVASLALGTAMLASAVRLARSSALADARRLMFASLIYLPVLFMLMAADKIAGR